MKPGRRYASYYTDVEVDVDVKELLDDYTDEELREFGLMRIDADAGYVPPAAGLNDHALMSSGLHDHLDAVRRCRRDADDVP